MWRTDDWGELIHTYGMDGECILTLKESKNIQTNIRKQNALYTHSTQVHILWC